MLTGSTGINIQGLREELMGNSTQDFQSLSFFQLVMSLFVQQRWVWIPWGQGRARVYQSTSYIKPRGIGKQDQVKSQVYWSEFESRVCRGKPDEIGHYRDRSSWKKINQVSDHLEQVCSLKLQVRSRVIYDKSYFWSSEARSVSNEISSLGGLLG